MVIMMKTKVVDKMGYWTYQWKRAYKQWYFGATEQTHVQWLMALEYRHRYRSKARRTFAK